MYIRIVCSCIWTANYSHSMRQEYPRFPLTIFSVNDSADPLISSKTNSSIYPAIYALCLSKPKGAKQNRFEHNLSTMRFFIAIVATLAGVSALPAVKTPPQLGLRRERPPPGGGSLSQIRNLLEADIEDRRNAVETSLRDLRPGEETVDITRYSRILIQRDSPNS